MPTGGTITERDKLDAYKLFHATRAWCHRGGIWRPVENSDIALGPYTTTIFLPSNLRQSIGASVLKKVPSTAVIEFDPDNPDKYLAWCNAYAEADGHSDQKDQQGNLRGPGLMRLCKPEELDQLQDLTKKQILARNPAERLKQQYTYDPPTLVKIYNSKFQCTEDFLQKIIKGEVQGVIVKTPKQLQDFKGLWTRFDRPSVNDDIYEGYVREPVVFLQTQSKTILKWLNENQLEAKDCDGFLFTDNPDTETEEKIMNFRLKSLAAPKDGITIQNVTGKPGLVNLAILDLQGEAPLAARLLAAAASEGEYGVNLHLVTTGNQIQRLLEQNKLDGMVFPGGISSVQRRLIGHPKVRIHRPIGESGEEMTLLEKLLQKELAAFLLVCAGGILGRKPDAACTGSSSGTSPDTALGIFDAYRVTGNDRLSGVRNISLVLDDDKLPKLGVACAAPVFTITDETRAQMVAFDQGSEKLLALKRKRSSNKQQPIVVSALHNPVINDGFIHAVAERKQAMAREEERRSRVFQMNL